MVDGELTLQSACDVLLVAEIQHERSDSEANCAYGIGRDSVFVMNLDSSIDGGVIHDSARKRFIGVGAQIEIDAESMSNLGQIVLGRLDRDKTSRTLETVYAGGESGFCEQRRSVAILRGTAWMERFRHGTEHLA